MSLRFSRQSVPQGCIPFRECRAKTCPDGKYGTSVFDHCRYAGYVAEGLLALLPDCVREQLPLETPFLVALHDIGKVSPEYENKYFAKLVQEFAPEWASTLPVRGHATIGAISLMSLFDLFPDEFLVSVVAAHHGFWPDAKQLIPKENLGDFGAWQNERGKLVEELAKDFGTSIRAIQTGNANAELLAGLTCVSDWIASDKEFFPPEEPPLSPIDGRARAAHALAICGFSKQFFRKGLSFRDVFGFNPYPAQSAFLEAISSPGVYVLEAPMGMGKTESALYAAYRLVENGTHAGLYFALPTRLTSDRIHERVDAFLKAVSETPTAVRLAHGQAWLKEFATGAEGSDKDASRKPPPWFNPSKRGLLFPFAVGTIDQALMAVLNVKHAFVRSFALAGKVVILDEVHSYDAYTGTLLDALVARLRDLGCTVIVLSATLTAARRKELLGEDAPDGSGYPLLSGVRADGFRICIPLDPPPSREVRLRWLDASVESPIVSAIEKARAGCNVLCIANTVATAQEWFRELRSEMKSGEFPVGVLHARFTAGDRERIEDDWMKRLGKKPKEGPDPRPHGSILVSTQIVEQSVDIDADWMISELAPADMLLQRTGRLWRHNREKRPVEAPELAVVCNRLLPDDTGNIPADERGLEEFFGKGVWVYAPFVLLRTFEILRDRETLLVPDGIRSLLEKVYSEKHSRTPLHEGLFAMMKKKANELRNSANMGMITALQGRVDDDERAGTRYSSRPAVSLLLLQSLDGATGHAILLDGSTVEIPRFHRDFTVMCKLYQSQVQVSPNEVLMSEGVRKQAEDILRCHFFASDMPRICLWNAQGGNLRLFGTEEEAGYCYHPLYGAYRMGPNEIADSHKMDSPDVPFAPINLEMMEQPENSPEIDDPEGVFLFENGKDW